MLLLYIPVKIPSRMYIKMLVIFSVLKILVKEPASKPILYILTKIYYEGQRWVPMIIRTRIINILCLYILKGINGTIFLFEYIFSQVTHHTFSFNIKSSLLKLLCTLERLCKGTPLQPI